MEVINCTIIYIYLSTLILWSRIAWNSLIPLSTTKIHLLNDPFSQWRSLTRSTLHALMPWSSLQQWWWTCPWSHDPPFTMISCLQLRSYPSRPMILSQQPWSPPSSPMILSQQTWSPPSSWCTTQISWRCIGQLTPRLGYNFKFSSLWEPSPSSS